MRQLLLAALALAACSSDRTGIVVQREWSRTVREQRESCYTTIGTCGYGDYKYTCPETHCSWITLQTWEEHGGIADARPPIWPEFTARSSSSLRYVRDERYAVTMRLPDGTEREWTTSEPLYYALRPGRAFAFSAGPWSIGEAKPLEAEAPAVARESR